MESIAEYKEFIYYKNKFFSLRKKYNNCINKESKKTIYNKLIKLRKIVLELFKFKLLKEDELKSASIILEFG